MAAKETIAKVVRDPRAHILAAALAGGGLGSLVTYTVVKKKLETKYDKISGEEIEAAKEYYSGLASMNRVIESQHAKEESPADILKKLHGEEAAEAARAHASYLGVEPEEETSETSIQDLKIEATQVKNIFVEAAAQEEADLEAGWDYEAELRIRAEHPDSPYIISHDEFMENETEYEQASLTYYHGDDTLADDRDVPVPDVDQMVGEDNLTRFGHGSKDELVLYVRNDRLEMDFDIAYSFGKYLVEVLGFDDPDALKHSDQRSRKFRGHDE
jgi:hypothetical protein